MCKGIVFVCVKKDLAICGRTRHAALRDDSSDNEQQLEFKCTT